MGAAGDKPPRRAARRRPIRREFSRYAGRVELRGPVRRTLIFPPALGEFGCIGLIVTGAESATARMLVASFAAAQEAM